MRAFIAIEIGEDTREALRALTQRLRQGAGRVSWVKPENLHLTLRFLGDVEEDALDEMADTLEEAYSRIGPFHAGVRETGVFPNSRRPSVVWAGVAAAAGKLEEAHAIAEAGARAIGIAPEKRPFRPHITLGRIRNPKAAAGLTARLEAEREFDAGEFAVRSVSLFSSALTPQGALHRRLREFTFRWESTSDSSIVC